MTRERAVIKNQGFTMIEVLIALVILAVALFPLLVLNRYSNRGAMDSYFDLLGMQLVQEPIEIFQTFGYDWVDLYKKGAVDLVEYPLDEWKNITENRYPTEATMFQRRIELKQLKPLSPNGVNFYLMKVLVKPKEKSRAKQWFSRNEMSMEVLIVERTK